jgi:hypothetical protein
LDDTNTPGGSPEFLHQLLGIRQDPVVIGLALRWAHQRELAEDALQTAYLNVARTAHPERIVNLRAYFLRAVRNEINGLYSLTPTVSLDDLESLGPSKPGRQLDESATEDRTCRAAQKQDFLRRYADCRDRLIRTTPARSTEPSRYREVIYAAAKQVLLGALNPEPKDPAFPRILRAAYPDYFDEPAAAPNTLHQRISRARDDIKALLQAVIKREELY